MVTNIKYEKTRNGLPALWESGGGSTNTGSAHIVAGPNGEKLTPLYIRTGGHLSNREHALFAIRKGMYYISTWHHRGDANVQVYMIDDIIDEHVILSTKYTFVDNQWDIEPPDYLHDAINASMDKAKSYHCRIPYFANIEAYESKLITKRKEVKK